MNAYAKLPALLERIDAASSGATLCRRRHCYAVAFTWLSPYCQPSCAPWIGGAWGAEDSLILWELREQAVARAASSGWGWNSEATFELNRYSLMTDWRISSALAAPASGLSPFIHINSAC